jgi:hypothetical protein
MITTLYVVFGVIVGVPVLFFVLFLILHANYSRRQERAVEMEAEYGAQQVQRANEKIRMLMQIGAPECPDGTFSPNQAKLWKYYSSLDQQDQAQTEQERLAIVETRGYS